MFNLKLNPNSKNSTACSYYLELKSPSTIKKKLLKIAKELGDNKFNIEMFKSNYKEIFWNLVWFFELNNMDISFMLPYCDESCVMSNDSQAEKIKNNVIIKNEIDKNIDINKIVNNQDLNVSIIFYGNVEALGEKIDEDEIKNNIFTNVQNQYLMNDLVIQKIYQLYISDKTGMISYMGFDTFSDNIGFNEYPVQFDNHIQENDATSFYSFTNSSSLIIELNSLNESNSSINSNQQPNVPNKSNSFNLAKKKKEKMKNVNFEENNLIKNTSTFKPKQKGVDGILKLQNIKLPKNSNVEIKPSEDIDFLSKFKEGIKKVEKEIKKDNNDNDKENDNNNITTKNNELRKSTLKDGILFDNDKESDEDYEDYEEE